MRPRGSRSGSGSPSCRLIGCPDLEKCVADTPPVHPELAAEQSYIDAAYARLDAMRASAAAVAAGFSEVGAGGTHQARLERDVADSVTRRRLAALDIGDAALVFGRLDRTADVGPAERHFYIGRIAVN